MVSWIIGAYLAGGILALGLLELLTKRIHRKLKLASIETQSRMVASGSLLGYRSAIVLTIIALWLFWPVAIFGALSTIGGNHGESQ